MISSLWQILMESRWCVDSSSDIGAFQRASREDHGIVPNLAGKYAQMASVLRCLIYLLRLGVPLPAKTPAYTPSYHNS
jgi:hypothetical protein